VFVKDYLERRRLLRKQQDVHNAPCCLEDGCIGLRISQPPFRCKKACGGDVCMHKKLDQKEIGMQDTVMASITSRGERRHGGCPSPSCYTCRQSGFRGCKVPVQTLLHVSFVACMMTWAMAKSATVYIGCIAQLNTVSKCTESV